MSSSELAILAGSILIYGLLSKRLNSGIITLPLAFAAFGFLTGDGGLGIIAFEPGHGVIHLFAEFTLVMLLFSDAARLDVRQLARERAIALRMLLIGLPLAILLGAGLAALLFPAITVPAMFLLAAILAPTDAALGQAVITSPDVPEETRQVMTAESGLNDGLALPAVMVFAIWAGAKAEGLANGGDIVAFAASQVVLGPLIGAVVAWAGGSLIDRAIAAGRITGNFEGIAMLALAILAFAGAESLGGNGFLAAFTGGVVLGCTVRHRCGKLLEFMEEEGQLLTLFTFLLFGATLLPEALDSITVPVAIYAVASLFVVRVIAIQLSLIGSGTDLRTGLFMGWFGPRGLASILFALLILDSYPVPERAAIHACVMLTVALSILLHGLSAAPLARLYGRNIPSG
jgi:NhaP-type Na+/H+ or K+/H+ antiporter